MMFAIVCFAMHLLLWAGCTWILLPLCDENRFSVFQFHVWLSRAALIVVVVVAFVASYRVLSRVLRSSGTRKHVIVLCLGDLGRSPRMQYHALSLADTAELEVSMVGYGDSRCHQQVLDNSRIRLFYMTPFPPWFRSRALRLLYYVSKVIWQVSVLLWTVLYVCARADFVLVQNPPSIPSLAICVATKLLSGAKLVIDWHNFGYTILSMAVGPKHPLVSVAYYYERFLGKCSDANLCVTKAMCDWLREQWGIEATVLYDKAPAMFQRLDVDQVHELWTRLQKDPKLARHLEHMHVDTKRGDTIMTQIALSSSSSSSSTKPRHGSRKRKSSKKKKKEKEKKERSEVTWRPDRPAVLVSSTSWTADEDFSILLDAIKACEKYLLRRVKGVSDYARPALLVLITGKGPLRAMYEQQIAELGLRMTAVETLWLEAEDYPRLLGSVDMGVSLHTSSSGLDLPMKVVDMFGAQLPVCAIDFKCLDELVHHGRNGLVFNDAAGISPDIIISNARDG